MRFTMRPDGSMTKSERLSDVPLTEPYSLPTCWSGSLRLEEECEDDGLASIVREANRVAEDSIPCRTDDGEFGRHGADLGHRRSCWLLGRQASTCGKERGRGDGKDALPMKHCVSRGFDDAPRCVSTTPRATQLAGREAVGFAGAK